MPIAAGVQAIVKPSLMIETFEGDWEKEWFTYKPEDWARRTHKLYDDQWRAPESAQLAFDVLAEKPNTMVVGVDEYAAEIHLDGLSKRQRIILSPEDFHNAAGEALSDWMSLKELRFSARETLKKTVDGESETLNVGADWTGSEPVFHNLRWIEK